MSDAEAFLELGERQVAAPRKARMRAAETRAARKKTATETALDERGQQVRAWRRWHREQLDEALAGPHGRTLERLLRFLESMTLQSAPALVELVRSENWKSADYVTRLVALHEINGAITALRERHGLAPFDDGLPGEPATAFGLIKDLLQ
jgi:hypothetical protein